MVMYDYRKCVNVKVKDIVVRPGMEMLNSSFRCWEPITKVVKIPDNKYGNYEVHSAVDYSIRGPDEELQLVYPEDDQKG